MRGARPLEQAVRQLVAIDDIQWHAHPLLVSLKVSQTAGRAKGHRKILIKWVWGWIVYQEREFSALLVPPEFSEFFEFLARSGRRSSIGDRKSVV